MTISTGVTARTPTSASSGRHLALLGAAAEAGVRRTRRMTGRSPRLGKEASWTRTSER
jgi:hypothetical protein